MKKLPGGGRGRGRGRGAGPGRPLKHIDEINSQDSEGSENEIPNSDNEVQFRYWNDTVEHAMNNNEEYGSGAREVTTTIGTLSNGDHALNAQDRDPISANQEERGKT